jgi:transcription elongation factor S-II
MLRVDNPEQFRAKIQSQINQKVNNEKYSINLEKGIHNWTLNEATNRKVVKKWNNTLFVQLYVDHYRSIYFNLSEYILTELHNGNIKAQNIAFMTHQELKPEKWEVLIQSKIKRDKNKYETNIESSTDTFTCRKCYTKKCTYYQMQTRSADEPMTTFVTCIECGNRWKC